MRSVRLLLSVLTGLVLLAGVALGASGQTERSPASDRLKIYSVARGGYLMSDKIDRSEAEWRQLLTPEQFHILREQGTERAYSGNYWDHHEDGIYRCAGCGLDLFSSETKYDSESGWPSYYAPVAPENVATRSDRSLFMVRTEVLCSRCNSHLGHLFGDGPKPSGLRYCINSAALSFAKRGE